MTWLLRIGLTVAAIGAIWSLWPLQDADREFRPIVARPVFGPPRMPRVVIDEGHFNVHTAGGRYQPFAQLLMNDGFRVLAGPGRITHAMLNDADVFVTANPLGFRGLLQHGANLARLERVVRLDVNAFAPAEVETLAQWVFNGGRALIVADHAPAGAAARALAAAFGVEMTTWWAEDASNHDPVSRHPGALIFSRDNGLLADHPIAGGRSGEERVQTVMTFGGQALRPPPHGEVLLRLSDSAREYPYRASREREGRSAAGLAQAVALRHGRGRIVVFGEAGALTAQRIETAGAAPIKIGMNREGLDNQQFVLNVMHWLMGLLE